MFDLAWSEILLIAVVAVVFIGPKELPAALRTFGKWTAKARVMASEFQRNLDDMVREAELEDVKKQFDEVRGIATNPTGALEKWVDPKGEIRGAFTPPESGTTPVDKPGYDNPGLDKPGETPLDRPAATALAPVAPQPVVAPAPAVPAAEPVPPPQAASVAPPVVTPPPAGEGAIAEPSQSSTGAKTPATAP
jgi:sec-independent protein translocase protein TatB